MIRVAIYLIAVAVVITGYYIGYVTMPPSSALFLSSLAAMSPVPRLTDGAFENFKPPDRGGK